MKKVAFLITSLNSGGIENYLLRFLKYSEGRIRPIVICKGGVFGDLLEEYKKIEGIKLVSLKVGYFDFAALTSIYKILKKHGVHTVCDFTGNFAGLSLFVASFTGIKTRIAFYRGSTNHFREDRFRLLYDKVMKYLVTHYATNVFSNSLAALNFFFPERDRTDEKYSVIYNGIDPQRFCTTRDNLRQQLSIPEHGFVVGHVGRYNVAKNHGTIMEVAKKICNSYSNVYFILCGRGVDEHLREEVQSAGLERQIKLLGNRADVDRVLNSLDVFYFPSVTEGQPNALIEAMVMGVPFVASNISPILETVPEELNQFLFDPYEVEGVVDKIVSMYNGHCKTESLNCADWARQRFSADKCFKLFMSKL